MLPIPAIACASSSDPLGGALYMLRADLITIAALLFLYLPPGTLVLLSFGEGRSLFFPQRD